MEVNRFISTSDHDQDVVDFLNTVYDKAAEKGWSDLHFETLLNGDIEVRARILGQLSIIETLPKHMAHTLDIKMRYRCDLDVADNRLEQDGRFMQECHGRRIDVRYNRVTTTNGFSKVTRLLDSANAGKPIEDLSMPPAVEQMFRAALALREGLILTTGPTGCHAKGHPILMDDGRLQRNIIRNIEDIVVGNLVMGPDGSPRSVLKLHRGIGRMVCIMPAHGAPFTVNEDHILALKRVDAGAFNTREMLYLSVREWMMKPADFQENHHLCYALQSRETTAFQAEDAGIGHYYGFELDGDHLYVDGNFMVHHNSGKTTTLYAGLGHLNQVIRKIITAEDPVEYRMERVQQIPVGQGTGRTFHTALRAMMRQDPDIILVGEIRDQETAVAAMRAGMTGHLVLSTLHANSAVDTYFRLEDLGVPRHILAASVKIIIAQRIIKIVCPHCAEEHPVEFPEFFTSWGMEPPETEMVGAGCEACSGVGYISRMALFECIRMTKEFRDALVDREAMQRVADRQPQYQPLAKTALDLVLQKKTNSRALVEGLSDAE